MKTNHFLGSLLYGASLERQAELLKGKGLILELPTL